MICEKCTEQNLKSKVYSSSSTSTLMMHTPYYDENGLYHNHNPNKRFTIYKCNNNHKFEISYLNQCMNCEYGKDSEKIRFIEIK